MHGGRKTRRKLKALEKGWNSRAFIADSRNNPRVHETHRAYFDKIPGQRYVSINYDLYGAMANTHRRANSLGAPQLHGASTLKRGRNRTLGEADYAYMDDPSEFTVVVHVVSATGERLPGSTVAVYVKHSGEAVGTGTADRTGRAVVVCHYDAWTAVPFYLEAQAPGHVAAGLDFEVTAKECAAQLALESEEEVAHREAMAKLSEEEARRLSRQRFTVRALVSHLSSGKPVPGATVIVRTAHHGSMCGQGVTDAGGVAEVACAHPHWDTTPLRAEVAIRGFVPTSADLRAVVGSAFMDTNLRVETEEEVAARGEADAAKFSVWAVIRDRADNTPVPGADVEVEHAASRTVLARARTQPDGSALLMCESENWATESFAVHVRHPEYPAYREAVQIRTREHRFEAHMTSARELERQRAAAAATAAQRQAEAKSREEEERAAAARALKDVEDHTRVNDEEFVLTVYAVSLFKGTVLPSARVSVVVKATGQLVGEGVADGEGCADVTCTYPDWRDTEFLLQASADGYASTAKAVRPTKALQMLRVALEDDVAANDSAEHEFRLTVHVTDGEGKRELEGANVTLRIKATAEDLATGVTDSEGTCVLRAVLAGWREQGMYLHVSADGHSSAASDINVTSKEHTTEVALDSNQVAHAKRLHRSETSASMRAQRARFSLKLKCVDAATKAPIPGAVLRLAVQATGRVIGTGIADEGGATTIDATYKRWNKTPMVVEATKDGWVTIPQQMQVPTAEYEAQVVLCEPVPEGRMKAVLTWVEEPQDLDLHVLCPNGADVNFKTPKDDSMGVHVEMDDRSGYGPETIAFKLGHVDDWFRVVARNFSKDVSITVSNAQVALVAGDRVAHMFHVPGSQSTNEWWDVCGVHGRSGRVVETNYLLEEQPDRERGLRGVDPDGKDVAADALDDDDDW